MYKLVKGNYGVNVRSRLLRAIACLLMAACLWGSAYAQDMKASVKVSGGGTYDYVVVGSMTGAEDGFDNLYDTVSPGPSMNDTFIFTSIPHPEWGAIKDDFRADIRSAQTNQVWVVTVSTNVSEGTPFSLSLDGEKSIIPEGYTLTVTDAETGAVVALDGTIPYEFAAPAEGTMKELRIEARYETPVTEEPSVTEEPPVSEEPAAEQTTQSSTEDVLQQDDAVQYGSHDDQAEGVIGGTYYIATTGNNNAVKERHARPVPPAPAMREYASNPGGGFNKPSVNHGGGGGTQAIAGGAYQIKSEPIVCKNVFDNSGVSIIYCGVEISQEEILRRASGGKIPNHKNAFASNKSGNKSGFAIGRLLSGLRKGLGSGRELPGGVTKVSGPFDLFKPVLFERFNRAFTYQPFVPGLEVSGIYLNNN